MFTHIATVNESPDMLIGSPDACNEQVKDPDVDGKE